MRFICSSLPQLMYDHNSYTSILAKKSSRPLYIIHPTDDNNEQNKNRVFLFTAIEIFEIVIIVISLV